MVRLAPGPDLTPGDLAKSHPSTLGQQVISPAPISPLLSHLEFEASEGAGRPEGMNPRVRVGLPPQLVFSEKRHAGHMFSSGWSGLN